MGWPFQASHALLLPLALNPHNAAHSVTPGTNDLHLFGVLQKVFHGLPGMLANILYKEMRFCINIVDLLIPWPSVHQPLPPMTATIPMYFCMGSYCLRSSWLYKLLPPFTTVLPHTRLFNKGHSAVAGDGDTHLFWRKSSHVLDCLLLKGHQPLGMRLQVTKDDTSVYYLTAGQYLNGTVSLMPHLFSQAYLQVTGQPWPQGTTSGAALLTGLLQTAMAMTRCSLMNPTSTPSI